MARRPGFSDYRAMKHVIALLLLCVPAQLLAADRCNMSRQDRSEIARIANAGARPATPRPETARQTRAPALKVWQRVLIFEQQIL